MAEISAIEILIIISEAVWVIFPAYIANSSAVLFGHGTPVDMGRKFRDGRRILGDGKTWYGLLGGSLAGIAFGFGQILGSGIQYPKHHWGYGPVPNAYIIAILIPVGALLGDLLGSFIKRRCGLERGQQLTFLDIYDLALGVFIVLLIFEFNWFYETFLDGFRLIGFITVLILTPLLHRFTNIIGYKLGKKKEPW
jgi:CDP-2,3-bis-(O-geranylgeranyl)-sn-glycerol synthase